MKSIIKLLGIVVFFLTSFSFGQNKNTLSNGVLEIDGVEKLEVKIFSSPRMSDILEALKSDEENILVILNKSNTKLASQEEWNYLSAYYQEFRNRGFKLLDKDFQLVGSIEEQVYYILKSSKNIELQNHQVQLNTDFIIWNPDEGINILGFNLRYYGLMFVIAFGLGFLIMKRIFKIDGVDEKFLDPLFTWTLFGTIFGARIGHVLFYDAHLFVDDFWSVFLPIRTKPTIEFTGFAGLASHGAAIALILTTLYYSLKIIKKNPFWVYDRLGIVIALAGFFIRMGNFFNSEIIGKPNESFLAIYFPQQSLDYGVIVPRYPTQLIEGIGYLILFFLLWLLYRLTNKKHQEGWLFGLFLMILWSIRFFVEFLKEPQGEEYISFLGLNTGQILSLPFIFIGLGLIIYSKKKKEN